MPNPHTRLWRLSQIERVSYLPPMRINWAKGFFRAWAVFAALWILFVGLEVYNLTENWSWSDLKSALLAILFPPFAVLIAGLIFGWIIKGFRSST